MRQILQAISINPMFLLSLRDELAIEITRLGFKTYTDSRLGLGVQSTDCVGQVKTMVVREPTQIAPGVTMVIACCCLLSGSNIPVFRVIFACSTFATIQRTSKTVIIHFIRGQPGFASCPFVKALLNKHRNFLFTPEPFMPHKNKQIEPPAKIHRTPTKKKLQISHGTPKRGRFSMRSKLSTPKPREHLHGAASRNPPRRGAGGS